MNPEDTQLEKSDKSLCSPAPLIATEEIQIRGYDFIPYFLASFLTGLNFFIIHWYNNYFIVLWVAYVVFPYLDILLPVDRKNYTEAQQEVLYKDKRYLIPLYTYYALEWTLYIHSLWFITRADFGGYVNLIIFVYSAANGGAANGVIGHELFHKKEKVHKIAGASTYYKMLYMHFFIEHIFGHHRNVALEKDPATARKNESLYTFLGRSSIGGFRSAWHIEETRLSKIYGAESVTVFRNRVFIFTLSYIPLLAMGYFISGVYGVLYQIIYGVLSVFFLEATNYIEHYGLQRKQISPGVFETVGIKHSWNAPQRITNLILFKLQRHSDHHANSYKPYQTLCSYEESPTHPHGYTVGIILAAIPPVWFKVMNPLLEFAEREEKPDEATMKRVDKLSMKTIVGFSMVLTFIMFMTLL